MKYPQAVVTRPSDINRVRRLLGIRSSKQEHQVFFGRILEEACKEPIYSVRNWSWRLKQEERVYELDLEATAKIFI